MKRKWIGFAVVMIMLLAVTVWADTGPVGIYQPCTVDNPSGEVHIEIRPEIELLAGVLSQTSWMKTHGPEGEGNQYFRELKTFFANYKDHPTVQMAEKLTQKGFTSDVPSNFILHLGPLPDLKPVDEYSDYLVQRAGGVENLEAFRQALVKLAVESNFSAFYNQQRPYLQKTLVTATQGLEGEQALTWLENFCGEKSDAYYLIFAPALFTGDAGYCATLRNETVKVYQIFGEKGTTTGDPQFESIEALTETALHSWGYSLIKPALNKYTKELDQLQSLYEPVKDNVSGKVEGFFCEQILRAGSAILIGDRNGRLEMEEKIEQENLFGYYLTRFTTQQLQYYRKNREKYPRFADFVPVLLKNYLAHSQELLAIFRPGAEKASEAEILIVINKWSRELYRGQLQLLGPVYLAGLLDPAPYEIVKGLNLDGLTPEQKVAALAEWIRANMVHTQSLSQYKLLPGNDVWGGLAGEATYKSSLPGEMVAMRALTGKVTEKCTSLAWFNAALFNTIGLAPENVVFLRTSSHTIGLVKLGERFYYLDNLGVKFVNSQVQQNYSKNAYVGAYNGRFSIRQSFKMDDPSFFTAQNTLEELFKTVKGLEVEKARYDAVLPPFKDRCQLVKDVFGKTPFGKSKVAALTRYAYYSLKVKRPELYLKAALRMPLVIDLAKQLDSTQAVFNWVQSNVQPGSIFANDPDRLMPAEDVVLFKKGNPMDKALLTWALLKLKGQDPQMIIGARNAYIGLENRIYDMEGFQLVTAIKEPVRFRLQL